MGKDGQAMQESSNSESETDYLTEIEARRLSRQAVWSGYQQPYIRNIIKGADKALTLLATLTFDPGLLFWVRGLANYLDGKIKEADEDAARLKRIEQGKAAFW